MVERLPKTWRPIPAALVGLLAALAVAGAYMAGLDRWAEAKALDLRFRVLGPAEASDRILCVDIDSASLAEIGPWPWPRERLAALVDVLRRCEAQAVALDVDLSYPQPRRYESPVGRPLAADLGIALDYVGPVVVGDDAALSKAIKEHGNVFLTVRAQLADPNLAVRTPMERAIESALRGRPTMTPKEVADTMSGQVQFGAAEFRRAKQRAIAARVRQILAADSARSLADMRKIVLPEAGPDDWPVETDMLRRAYLHAQSMISLRRFSVPPDRLGGYRLRSPPPVRAPLVAFVQAARGAGLQAPQADADGVVRGARLLGQLESGACAHLALVVAHDELAGAHEGAEPITADAEAVTIRCADGTQRRLPIDSDGQMVINWVRPRRGGFGRVSAARVAAPWLARKRLEREQNLARLLYLGAAKLVDTNIAKQLSALLARHDGDSAAKEAIEKLCKQVREQLNDGSLSMQRLAQQAKPDNTVRPDAGAEVLRKIREAGRQYEQLKRIRSLVDSIANRAGGIEAAIERDEAGIRKLVSGKICLISATAPAAAHLVATPVSKRMPPGRVWANTLNTILSGATIRRASRQDDLVVIGIAAAVVTIVSVGLSLGWAFVITLSLGAAYGAFNAAVMFARWHVWVAVVCPLAACAACFAAVAVFRRLTEEPPRRRIRAAFSGALPAEQVLAITAKPSLVTLTGEHRVVSCVILDLCDIAPLWERCAAQGLGRVMDRYFDRVGAIVRDRHGGYLDTLAGGAVALFNAPIAQEDHAARAVQAALQCRYELARLDESIAAELDLPPMPMRRAVVATGGATVGNFGVGRRISYTAAGEAVEMARQLVGAGEVLGARVLVCERTWRLGGSNDLLARPLGRLVLPGRPAPLSVWEVYARTRASGEVSQAFADFARAVDLLAKRKFEAAAELFEGAAPALGDDKPTQIYLELCRAFAARPPSDDWTPQIQLPPG